MFCGLLIAVVSACACVCWMVCYWCLSLFVCFDLMIWYLIVAVVSLVWGGFVLGFVFDCLVSFWDL